jgi:protein-S-isoprenylcysteine O-methyltransferase Ste14
MGHDLRLPIGAMFALLGALLACYGVVSDTALYERSLGVNVNLWWGICLLGFGLAMLALARRSARLRQSDTRKPGSPPSR